jgi:hypothetical protein
MPIVTEKIQCSICHAVYDDLQTAKDCEKDHLPDKMIRSHIEEMANALENHLTSSKKDSQRYLILSSIMNNLEAIKNLTPMLRYAINED